MATRMLIDARHPEETRVAVLKGNRIEEFDFESAEHKQIKGNIYLAKVTRVEPSLQAAFVDFGGNRHGFLAFSEIHPDYYQIPASDRAALIAEEQAAADEEAALRAEEDEDGEDFSGDHDSDEDDEDVEAGVEEIDTSEKDDVSTIEDGMLANGENGDDDGDETESADEQDASDDAEEDGNDRPRSRGRGRGRGRRQGQGGGGRRGSSGSRAKEMDELRARRQALRRRYKIQDVIQRRQVLLVQVVKEERGNKGAALTTYLSLAGRYCVLMPNSSHGGGISRKISNGSDRKRLKQIVSDLSLPKSMGLIVRTAGLQRNKTEIKRDFDYLARLWDEIRENTLKSSAPAVIHSDSDLVKRAIRDIYNREIEEVVVEGEDGYKAAKQFMKLLMPSHARRVKAYSDPVPLFQRYGAEDQLSAMYDPMVQLKSGGYLIINPTEALVSIDINSGRSTKEHGIEQTALHTNLEAAREIARQLRLRDMAGLVVIDFIDMEHNSNVRKVEKAMKDALKNDRARIQVGRISGFGLMEMSRQRLRTGVLEATTRSCPHCDGTGLVRTASSAGLSALRVIEDEAAKGKGTIITLYASTEAAVYLLNAKRADLSEIESRYGVAVEVQPEGEQEGAKMRVASSGPRPTEAPRFEPIVDDDDDDDLPADDDNDEGEDEETSRDDRSDESGQPRKRRRRRGGRGRSRRRDGEEGENENGEDSQSSDDTSDEDSEESDDSEKGGRDSSEEGQQPRKRRRRGGRGRGRKRSDDGDSGSENSEQDTQEAPEEVPASTNESTPEPAQAADAEEPVAEKPKRTRRRKPRAEADAEVVADADADADDGAVVEQDAEPTPEPAPEPAKAKAPRKPRKPRASAAKAPQPEAESAPEAAPEPPPEPAPEPANDANGTEKAAAAQSEQGEGGDESGANETGERRGGWWQRTFGA